MEPIGVDVYLAIAAELLGVDDRTIGRVAKIPLAESALHAPFASFGGRDFYPGAGTKAGVLCSRLVRNHPLPDGNKRAAYLTMLFFLELSGWTWHPPSEDERVLMIEGLAGHEVSEDDFVAWVSAHIT
jgi:death on curing protein